MQICLSEYTRLHLAKGIVVSALVNNVLSDIYKSFKRVVLTAGPETDKAPKFGALSKNINKVYTLK